MGKRHISLLAAGAVVLAGVGGCTCGGYRSGYPPTARTSALPAAGCGACASTGPQPPLYRPRAGAVGVPFVPAPTGPGVAAPPPGAVLQQNSYVAPASGAPSVSLAPPEPAEPPARPLPSDNGGPSRTPRLYAPQTVEPPPAKSQREATPKMPVDIPQFAVAKPDVANGLEPFAEGIAWLKAHGYRTVLHVRAPDEEDDAARRAFENGGLKYLSIQVSPRTLSKEIVDEFTRTVNDAGNRPLFVYDKDGSLAGGLWYLHFRLADKMTEEKARAEAAHLGFRQEEEGPHRTMWVAVQKFLESQKP